ncbi:MAG: phosphoribosylglycinamide formyltransferase [Flavobacteriales bacterium]|nr:phosphoribosylglycinamide formyltransferase [Flavobacteriales bacterium]|tara:strand:+ start:31257 stop:31829 length:573 start_codon:yes stop_codon:yes gene_type:complete
MKKRIAILASGAGSNTQCIIEYFKENSRANVVLVGCNNSDALVLKKAIDLGVHSFVFNKDELTSLPVVLDKLLAERVDLVVLAGFLLKVPKSLVLAFPNRIVNVHPALLPKFGGKGMYGKHVHRAVIDAQEVESGITIHYVNERYDDGAIIFQAKCDVGENDDVRALEKKVRTLEHEHYAKIIDQIIQRM